MLLPREFRGASVLATSVLFLLICSCAKHSSKKGLAAGPAMSRFIHFEFAVYLPSPLSTARRHPMQVLTESLGRYTPA
jgi:hypothetical protein